MTRLMKRPLCPARSLALAIMLVLGPASAFAQDTAGDAPDAIDASALGLTLGLTLKENVMVNDDVVRLGDLFAEPISNGDAPIAQAPGPGQTSVLDNRVLLVPGLHAEIEKAGIFPEAHALEEIFMTVAVILRRLHQGDLWVGEMRCQIAEPA